MKLEELLAKTQNVLESSKSEIHDRQIQDLVAHHLKFSWSDLYLKKSHEISQEQEELIFADLSRLLEGTPLAHITGERFFYKSEFLVTPDVLIPRPETEIIVEKAVEIVGDKAITIMDLGSGSGCIGLSIAKECPASQVILIEASAEALAVTAKNQNRLGLTNTELIQCELGVDPFPRPELKGQIDLIVTNPPYIAASDQRVADSVHRFEPHQALYASENGLFWIHKFILWSYDYLRPGGPLLIEFGRDQESCVDQLARSTRYSEIDFINDLTGHKRFIKLTK